MGENVEVKNKDGQFVLRLAKFRGILALEPFLAEREARYNKLLELKYKEGDVINANFPKTGTHWLMDSIAMLRRGKAEVVKHIGFEGFLDAFEDLDNLDQQDGPRYLETHLFPCHLSDDLKQKAKFIVILRNPKDTAVSMFYALEKMPLHDTPPLLWDDFLDIFFRGEVPPCSFFEYYRQWEEFILSHRDQCLIVYYEDMHKDYGKELRRLSDFLGIEISDDTIAAIAKKGTIHSITAELKKDPKVMEFAKKLNAEGNLPFYRKGIVGDWKNHFTVAQNEQVDKIIEEELKGSIFKFDYSV